MSLAADVAVGTAKVVGKGVGKAYDTATGSSTDNSGIAIRYRDSDPSHQGETPAATPEP